MVWGRASETGFQKPCFKMVWGGFQKPVFGNRVSTWLGAAFRNRFPETPETVFQKWVGGGFQKPVSGNRVYKWFAGGFQKPVSGNRVNKHLGVGGWGFLGGETQGLKKFPFPC